MQQLGLVTKGGASRDYGHTGSSGRDSQEEGILENAGYLVVHSGQVISSGVSMGIRFELGGLSRACQCGVDRLGSEWVLGSGLE